MQKAIDILRAFGSQAHSGLGVSELARRSELSKSTVHRLLSLLVEAGAVARVGQDYRHGAVLRNLHAPAKRSAQEHLRELLTPFLADLYSATGRTVYLAVLDGSEVLYLNKLHGTHLSRAPVRIGARGPSYSTGVGKAMLAFDPEAQRQLRPTSLVRWTAETLHTEDAVSAELALVRTLGIAIDRGETVDNVRCVAAPILGPKGQAVAALSVSGYGRSMIPEDYSDTVRGIAKTASRIVTESLALLERSAVSGPSGDTGPRVR